MLHTVREKPTSRHVGGKRRVRPKVGGRGRQRSLHIEVRPGECIGVSGGLQILIWGAKLGGVWQTASEETGFWP